MQNFATFWLEQWLKFLSAAGGWQAMDSAAFDSQIAQLRAAAANADAELKAVADERAALKASLDQATAEAAHVRQQLEGEIARLEAALAAAVRDQAAADERRAALDRELAGSQAAAAEAKAARAAAAASETALRHDLDKARDLAVQERKQFADEIGRLQKKAQDAAAAAAAAETRAAAAGTAHASAEAAVADLTARLARAEADLQAAAADRAAFVAELDQLRAAVADRAALEARLGELEQAAAQAVVPAAPAQPAPAAPKEAAVTAPGLSLHFKKPADWAETVHCHYWDGDTITTWPGVPMRSEGGGWFGIELADLRTATIVFNDNAGHQTPDLIRDKDGWYDGRWTSDRPVAAVAKSERTAARKPRKPAG